MTLLYHETTTHGMIATSSFVARSQADPRRYTHEGHFLAVDGPDEDVDEILKLPGYRLATAVEQNQYAEAKRLDGKLTETSDKTTEAPKKKQEKK